MKTRFARAPLLFLLLIPGAFALEAPRRISTQLVDLGQVHKIFLSEGLASVVQLPYPITEAKLGSPDTVQALISKTLPSELTLILRKNDAQPTNLVVRCGLRTFVFDLVPSKRTHQDLVRVSGTYGGPSSDERDAILIDSSHRQDAATSAGPGMILIDSSDGRPKGGGR